MSTYIGNTPEGAKNLQAQLPIGSVVAWPSAVIPSGWLECNGQSTTQYPILNALIGATVPDLRGEFIRGYDHGKGTDSGRTLLSTQTDDNKSHEHDVIQEGSANTFGMTGFTPPAGGTTYFAVRGGGAANIATDSIGTESRPVNVALMYIIKAFDVVSESYTTGVYAANKNYIVNPTFSINQRGFTGGNPGAATYGWDRWRDAGGTDTSTFSLPDANGFVTIVSSGANQGLQQRVEKFGYNGQMTLSWEGTALAQFYDSNGGAWSTPAASPITMTVDESSTVLPDAIELLMWGSGTIKNPKFEVGSIVTPFEYPDIATELAKCQRYWWQDGSTLYLLQQYTTAFKDVIISFPVEMRIAPTITKTKVGYTTEVAVTTTTKTHRSASQTDLDATARYISSIKADAEL